jgi:16S rRNA (adenine1518-N6/adenine1519-N6)-dimethyltransferase
MNINKILKQIEFKTKKRLGQNFLRDESVLDTILSHADIQPSDTVLEIGAGLGILTDNLSEKAGEVISLEIDPGLYAYLKNLFRERRNIRILLQDILKFDTAMLPEEGVKVIANLPYYISTPILMHILESVSRFSLILIMLQKELAERVTACPGTKKYGSLSIAVQFNTKAEIVAHVPRTAFFPVPKVDSALVRLQVLNRPSVEVQDEGSFFRMVRAAFAQRRKTLRNSLLSAGRYEPAKLDRAFEATGILPSRRAETLSVQEFADLYKLLH